MNSALQALFSISGLKEYFGEVYRAFDQCSSKFKKKYKLLYSFSELVNEVLTTKKESISPDEFKYHFGQFDRYFNNQAQHDAYEFMIILLEELENELKDLNKIKVKFIL